jgi:hypothetical protein
MTALPRKKLPIGIQSFAKFLENDEHYCVDKTAMAIDCVGINFSKTDRNSVGFEVERVGAWA